MTTKLLYIEDNPYSVYLMQFFLRRKQNYELTIATDAQTGWKQALKCLPDLIMLDINLPDFDGWELTRRFRSHPATQQIPIIAVTSYTMEKYLLKSKDVGIDLHLSKATNHRQLLQQVEALINERRV